MRVQQATRLHTNPEDHFGPGEFPLGDSGFMCTTNIIPFYKKRINEVDLHGRRAYFNTKGAKARVDIEHSFVILEGRWEILRNARLRLKTPRDEQRAILVMLAGLILHYLFVNTWQDHLSYEELVELAGDEFAERQRDLDGEDELLEFDEQYRRREELVTSMLELEKDEVDLEDWK